MEVLNSRILIRPADAALSRTFYRDILGLAVCREFGGPDNPGLVFFLGTGLLEVSGRGATTASHNTSLWLQVRDLDSEHRRLLTAGVKIERGPTLEPWGLREMWIHDPDGIAIVVVEVPEDHPLRRDQR